MAENEEPQSAPVFIRPLNGSSFKQRKTVKIIPELEKEFGSFAKGGVTVAAGGDVFTRPSTILQQKHLQLAVISVLRRTIPLTCTLPKSNTFQREVIRQVSTGDSNDEIL
jgi:hypothetical protein